MVVVPIIGTMQIDLSPIEGHNLNGHYRARSTADCHNSISYQRSASWPGSFSRTYSRGSPVGPWRRSRSTNWPGGYGCAPGTPRSPRKSSVPGGSAKPKLHTQHSQEGNSVPKVVHHVERGSPHFARSRFDDTNRDTRVLGSFENRIKCRMGEVDPWERPPTPQEPCAGRDQHHQEARFGRGPPSALRKIGQYSPAAQFIPLKENISTTRE